MKTQTIKLTLLKNTSRDLFQNSYIYSFNCKEVALRTAVFCRVLRHYTRRRRGL